MFDFKFFGAEPILINKVVRYTSFQNSGKYVFDPCELTDIIQSKKRSMDIAAMDQIVRELFQICNEGRRPWSVEAEQSFLSLAKIGYDLLAYLNGLGKVSYETYEFINPLELVFRLEDEAGRLEEINNRPLSKEDNPFCKEIAGKTLPIFYQITSIYISVFNLWTSTFHNNVELPSRKVMEYLLETVNDNDFTVLLTSFARTRKSDAKLIIQDFLNDDEQDVREISQRLIKLYWQ